MCFARARCRHRPPLVAVKMVGDAANNLKNLMRSILRNNKNCAALFGGQKNAENLLNKMTIYQVPSPYSGPFQGAYETVTASNNGLITGVEGAATTQIYGNQNGTWNGSSYGTFVGNKFNALTVSQQETALFHEMAHPYQEPFSAYVDLPGGPYWPYDTGIALGGGIPGLVVRTPCRRAPEAERFC